MSCQALMFIIFCILFNTGAGQENAGSHLPSSLKECYEDPALLSHEGRLPMTLNTFIELVRKAELDASAHFDMRTLSVALLHRFRMDGIERNPEVIALPGVIPFSPIGSQFTRHRILLSRLLPGEALTFPNASFTPQELCTLHFMLSSRVEPWERGDESEICPYMVQESSGSSKQQMMLPRIIARDPRYPTTRMGKGAVLSRCPIEDGLVLTSEGTVNMGTVLAGIAAGLYPQQVRLADLLEKPRLPEGRSTPDPELMERFGRYQALIASPILMHNTWVATLAGDLAEVAVYQGPRVEGPLYIGPSGEWNDTLVPRTYYMDQSNNGLWQMTDAEILGGLDGLILASMVGEWTEKLHLLRLSQVLEMYYSKTGVVFNPEYKACSRRQLLQRVLLQDKFHSQTTTFARVLSYQSSGSVQISNDKLDAFCNASVQVFNDHLEGILDDVSCDLRPRTKPKVHLSVILDGTWTREESIRLLQYLSEEVDVCHYGSSLQVLNGQDGSWILNKTHQAYQLFSLNNDTEDIIPWPTRMDLPLSLATLKNHLDENARAERNASVIGGPSHVILVLGYSATINNADFEKSSSLIRRFKGENPDVHFLYVGSYINNYIYKQLAGTDDDFPDYVVTLSDNGPESVVDSVVDRLASVPRRMMSAYCTEEPSRNEYEDYATPGQTLMYRIHPVYMKNSAEIIFKFYCSGQGSLTVCTSSRENSLTDPHACAQVEPLGETNLTVKTPCRPYLTRCPPLYLHVSVSNSLVKCAEDDCRYPDQVRFLIRFEGLQCVKSEADVDDAGSSTISMPNLILAVMMQVFSYVLVVLIT